MGNYKVMMATGGARHEVPCATKFARSSHVGGKGPPLQHAAFDFQAHTDVMVIQLPN